MIRGIPYPRCTLLEVCLGKTDRDSVQGTLQIAERPRVTTTPEFPMIEVEPGNQRSHRGQYRS